MRSGEHLSLHSSLPIIFYTAGTPSIRGLREIALRTYRKNRRRREPPCVFETRKLKKRLPEERSNLQEEQNQVERPDYKTGLRDAPTISRRM